MSAEAGIFSRSRSAKMSTAEMSSWVTCAAPTASAGDANKSASLALSDHGAVSPVAYGPSLIVR